MNPVSYARDVVTTPIVRTDDGTDRVPALDLLGAKVLLPRSRSATVRRTRLLRGLRAARDRRVISIVAPAGYGKTSLLVQWANQGRQSVAWLTVDDGDNDPVVFLRYLAAAIDRVEPLDPGLLSAIGSHSVSPRAAVGRLLRALQGQAEPVLIVLDDAHRLTDQACLDTLGELTTYMPEGSRVAIVGREPVALPFSRWRAEGSLLEIGPGELAMDEQEAAGLGRRLGVELSADALRRILTQTEGWPALLALAMVEFRRWPGNDARIGLASDRVIADYLRSEVLEGRPKTDVTFLLRTSILEQLSGPVCDVLAGRRDSRELLAGLAASTFLVDDYGGSYRYHVLLRDFLRSELTVREPERVAGLHRRAATWYRANGSLDLAVDHAFAGGDLDLAAEFVGGGMLVYHWSGRRATTRAWFRRLGDDALRERPWLAVLAAWEELGAGDVASTVHLADIAEDGTFDDRPPDGTASFESGRAMLRAAMCRSGVEDALENASRAVALEPARSPWRDFSLWMLALSLVLNGDPVGAQEALDEAIAAARAAGNIGLAFCLVGHRALLATDRGDWTTAAMLVDQGEELTGSAKVEGYMSSALARAAQARVAIHHGDIEAARLRLAKAMALRPLLTVACPGLAVESLLGFARAHLAIGDPAGARTLLAQAGQVIRLRPDLGVLPGEVAALRATIASLPVGMAGASSLTTSELRVLALLPYYLSFKEIGQRLGIKATTVKTHALAIYGKLGASTRSEAVDLAVEAGLLERFPA
jgi:LuxR family transcriptional regulator, maltose regulon positive regulatory protein